MQDTSRNEASAADPAPPVTQPANKAAPAAADYGLQVLPPASALVELVAIMAAILAADWIWPALDIQNLQPSPYWLPVLLLSLQYGTASGSLATMVAIAAYFALVNLPEQGVGENEFAYRLRILAQPILWIATAVLLGQFRMVQISAKRELARRVEDLEAQGRTLADYANRLRDRCDALERDIASRALPADARLLSALGDLRDARGGAAGAIERCLAAAFAGAAASVFVRQGGALTVIATTDTLDRKLRSTTLPADHPLTQAILAGRRRLSVLTAVDEPLLAGQGLAAVPLVDARNGRVVGMLKLDAAPPQLLTGTLLFELDAIASAVEPLIEETNGAVRLRGTGTDNDSGGGAAAAIPLRPQARLGAVSLIDPAAGASDAGATFDLVRPKVGH